MRVVVRGAPPLEATGATANSIAMGRCSSPTSRLNGRPATRMAHLNDTLDARVWPLARRALQGAVELTQSLPG
ncbi:hypothetical protein [Paracoccus aeridis]|uniref:hypothetical protein n=1 Tax=Paracoccus aeridis TaxID=1966466 RepID=UPI0010AA5622|nr:hypothetical protein [Paracoccus aeridis]